MNTLCRVCDLRIPEPPARVCLICRKKTTDNLTYLPYAFKALSNLLEPGAHDQSGIRTASGSRPPLSIPVLSLLGQDQLDGGISGDSRDQLGGPSILGTLGYWQRRWYELEPRGPRPGARAYDVVYVTGWLINRQQWAVVNLEPYFDFSREVGKVAHACLIMLAEERDKTIRIPGHCPVPDMENEGKPCGALLSVQSSDEIIRCYRCGGVWPRHAWALLGRLMSGVM